ncbi:glycosyltransferase family 2 protein [Mycobacterium riyadhense]|uniref:Beta-monoglucosyldiacylglycerol synthase n=1 Tax=Mycobacterium riyadhense TaxID=486698 RepID=A0A653EXK6_9MYCO|nr:glycosyltransferase [Mycobacterium riyadhense]MCV7145469.1 glycosyltransferase [Mycobacterium riyadhense]VTP02069.1 Beta-monoglucosyldiacylglycerol synthase [Mycobacterium riyadhense]
MNVDHIRRKTAGRLPTDSDAKVELADLHSLPVRLQDNVFAQSEGNVAHAIVHDFADRNPKMAARNGIRTWQKRAAQALAAACVIAAVLAPSVLLLVLLAITTGIVLVSFVVAMAGMQHRNGRGRAAAPELADEALPTYTVLVPAYREEEVIGDLVRCLAKLNYPADRLEVLFLVERTDVDTRAAIAAAKPPAYMRIVPVPPGPPRTKPRSCNAGLLVAKGELLVIFDAEDRPEPDQLRKAAAVFATNSGRLACVQAVLQTSNVRTNLLAHCFGVEYARRFRMTVPGLAALGAPFPLGGTSNHFRTRVLREVGGWDAWNVSEDADLGMRLHALGYRSDVVDSVTYGDAPDRLRDWISQRTRWHKGFLLTALVHTRNPFETIRRFGPHGLFSLIVFVLGMPAQFLAQTIIFGLSIADTLGYTGLIGVEVDPIAITGVQLVSTLTWLFATYLAYAERRRSHLRAVAALPLYWVAHWVAAWRALYQLVTAPFLWEKTAHRGPAAAVPAIEAERFRVTPYQAA